MPVIKQISIHESPHKLIKYILNPDKNEEMKFVTGLCCSCGNPDNICNEFRDVYERFSGARFYGGTDSEKSTKSPVLLFHYIQSFKPEECDAELAHKIGVQWAKRMFGSKRQVLISTHDDRSHIHNHFAVSVFELNGKRLYANKKTLEKCRRMSDKIALEYGLSVIDTQEYRANRNYGEWLHRKQGDSWKVKMMDDIDRLVLQNDVQNIDDLIEGLHERGYEVKQQKYISIKPPHGKHFIRSFRLGDGYSLECLNYRIANKDKEMSAEELSRYDGIQYRYAICLRELQLILYRRQESSIRTTYYEVVRSAELLCYMVNNHITTDEGFKLHVNERDEKYQAAVSRRKDIERKIAFEEKILSESGRFLELWNKEKLTPRETTELGRFQVLIDYKIYEDGELDKHRVKLSRLREELEAADSDAESAKAERKTAADNYRFYLEQMQDDFYAILERKKTDEARKERDLRIMEEYDRAKTGYQKENKEEGRNDRL